MAHLAPPPLGPAVKPDTYTLTCDRPGCPATITAPTWHAVTAAAQAAGWLTGPGIDACPDHWNRLEYP